MPGILLEAREDVCYVVSFQYTDDMFLEMVPEVLKTREDVVLLPFPSTGLSANRNNAMRGCATPLAIIADDDVRYTNEQLDMVIKTYNEHPEVDIACFQVFSEEGKPFKNYADFDFDYAHQPRGTYFSSLEMTFRLVQNMPSFDTRFGLGAGYLSCGEEEVFLNQAYRYGLHVHYYPQQLCTIPSLETTGSRFLEDKRVRRSKGAVFYMLYSTPSAFVRIIKSALCIKIEGKELTCWNRLRLRWNCFRDMFDGFMYVIKHPLNDSVADEIPLDFQPIDIWKMP